MATKKGSGSTASARVTVPGLKDSKGMSGFVVLPEGTHTVKCLTCKIKASDKSPADLWNFQFAVQDGECAGKRWSWRVTILQETHPKFDTVKMGIDELKSMCVAFGVVPKGDDLSPDAFADLAAQVRVGIKKGQDQQGNERDENKVYEWIAIE